MAVARVFLCQSLDPASPDDQGILTPLLIRLQESSIEVVSYAGRLDDSEFQVFVEHALPTCQWFILLQTPQLVADPRSREAASRALDLAAQKHLKGIFRVTTTRAGTEPSTWSMFPAFDGMHDPLRAIEKLLLALSSGAAAESPTSLADPALEPLPLASQPEPLPGGLVGYDRPSKPASRLVKFRDSVRNRYQDTMYSSRRTVIIVSLLVLVVLLGSATLLIIQRAAGAKTAGKTPVTIYGTVTFYSTSLAGAETNKGISDGVKVSLWHLSSPVANQSYYAWLLPDISNAGGSSILLGQFDPGNGGGNASITYVNPNLSNLLGTESRFLITEESSSPTPMFPTPDLSKWRYYGAFPQVPNSQDPHHLSALDHLRYLLSDDTMSSTMSLPGGLGVWLLQNTRLIFEWASAAWGEGRLTQASIPATRAELIAILDTLDGAEAVQQDLPKGTPVLVDGSIAQKPILTLDSGAKVPGYIIDMNEQLLGLVSSPGITQSEQALAGTISAELNSLQNTLSQVREDAKELEAEADQDLLNDTSNALFSDLVNQALAAYNGQANLASASPALGGVLLIFNQLQQLSQFPVLAYS